MDKAAIVTLNNGKSIEISDKVCEALLEVITNKDKWFVFKKDDKIILVINKKDISFVALK